MSAEVAKVKKAKKQLSSQVVVAPQSDGDVSVASPPQTDAESQSVKPPASLTRKEQRKMKLKKDFEKKLARHNSREQRIRELAARTANDPVDNSLPTPAAVVELDDERHHPRNFAGTFWKSRKDEKRRTLFLGNLPPDCATQDAVKELISTSVASFGDKAASDVVARVDFMAARHQNLTARNAYVVCASFEAAQQVAQMLDQYEIRPGRWLRCNFSNDKEQRSIAIGKRSSKVPGRRGGRGGSGGAPPFRGRGRGGANPAVGFRGGRGGSSWTPGGAPQRRNAFRESGMGAGKLMAS